MMYGLNIGLKELNSFRNCRCAQTHGVRNSYVENDLLNPCVGPFNGLFQQFSETFILKGWGVVATLKGDDPGLPVLVGPSDYGIA